MKITSINRGACRQIRDAINEALQGISEELGIEFKAGNASYDDSSVTFKVECVLAGVDKAKEEFDKARFLFNLPADAYGKPFTSRGTTFTLCGLKPNSPKFPILGMRADGKRYKFQRSAIRSLEEYTEDYGKKPALRVI